MLIEDSDRNCPVHGTELKEDRVLIRYGLPRYSSEYHAAHRTQFPCSKFVVLGGCMIGTEVYHNVMFCADCRTEHISWCKAHSVNYDLPLSPEDEDRYVRQIMGNSEFSGEVPNKVHSLLSEGKQIEAIKLLKASNPSVEISVLRAHVTYLQRKGRS